MKMGVMMMGGNGIAGAEPGAAAPHTAGMGVVAGAVMIPAMMAGDTAQTQASWGEMLQYRPEGVGAPKFCEHCGCKLDGGLYCGGCGRKIAE